MICGCNILNNDEYEIEFVQGDYFSVVFTITDEYDDPVKNVENAVFTCERLGLQYNLTPISDREYLLTIDGSITSTFETFSGTTYDLTLQLKDSDTPLTLIHDASLVVLKKVNKLNEGGDDNGDNNA